MSILVIGDSFSSQLTDPGLTIWPTLLGQHLNKQVINHAIPGTGYIQMGDPWRDPARFTRQLLKNGDLTPSAVELVIIFGSVNDRFLMPGSIDYYRMMTFETHREAQRLYPNAKHLIITPQWSGPYTKPIEIDLMRQAINDSMWGYDWQYPYLEPNDPNQPQGNWWFPPTRPELWAADQFHPNNAGHLRMLSFIEPRVRSMLGI